MSLSLTLDYPLKSIVEPGFHQYETTHQLSDEGFPDDSDSAKGIWRDKATQTLMLRPRQLDPDFLDSPEATSSIIRLGEMTYDAGDGTALRIFEQPTFGNTSNLWVHHNPVGPASGFPSFAPPFPGSPPSLTGINMSDDITDVDVVAIQPVTVYEPRVVIPPYTSVPLPVTAGGAADSKVVARTTARLEPNQGLFFRWMQADARVGFQSQYWWYVGQFLIVVRMVTVQVFQDISAAGDRTAWRFVTQAPMYSIAQGAAPPKHGSYVDFSSPASEQAAHERWLLWMPYRRNQIYLESSAGHFMLITVRPFNKRLADDSDWDIVRGDTAAFRVLTTTPGRFQIQKLLFTNRSTIINMPPFTLDYTPALTPTATVVKDSDHGSTLAAVITDPPGYTVPVNTLDTCPPQTTTTGDQSKVFGCKLSFHASSDQRWTPFFYGLAIDAPRTFDTPSATPVSVGATSPNSAIVSAKISAGEKPGDGRLTVEVLDRSPYPLATNYYRSGTPLQLLEGTDALFTGIITDPEVTPMPTSAALPRRMTINAHDPWKRLAFTTMRDQKDWTGYGHIDVVRSIVEQGGVDTTGGEFPSGYTVNVLSTVNSPLGGTEKTTEQSAKNVQPMWQPKRGEKNLDFIDKIVDKYSRWLIGFRTSGRFFYLPRNYFTAPSVVFSAVTSGGTPPFYRAPVTFTTMEPEANGIIVYTGEAHDGSVIYSSLWMDFASWKNSSVVNYVGTRKIEAIKVSGTTTCSELNFMARTIWNQTRRRRITVKFEADTVIGLEVGHVVTLGPWGNYRITGFETQLRHRQDFSTQYSGELLELGYGLP